MRQCVVGYCGWCLYVWYMCLYVMWRMVDIIMSPQTELMVPRLLTVIAVTITSQ